MSSTKAAGMRRLCKRAREDRRLHGVVSLPDVVEQRVELAQTARGSIPRVQQLVDALADAAAEHEAALGRVQDGMAREDAASRCASILLNSLPRQLCRLMGRTLLMLRSLCTSLTAAR